MAERVTETKRINVIRETCPIAANSLQPAIRYTSLTTSPCLGDLHRLQGEYARLALSNDIGILLLLK